MSSTQKSTAEVEGRLSQFASSLRLLREKLGLTQHKMAFAIDHDMHPNTYQRWELGTAVPDGRFLLRILALCPDRESLETFIVRDRDAPAAGKANELDEMYSRALTAVQTLGRLKAEGNHAASEALRALADQIVKSAGILADPTITKGRRRELQQALISEISRIDS